MFDVYYGDLSCGPFRQLGIRFLLTPEQLTVNPNAFGAQRRSAMERR